MINTVEPAYQLLTAEQAAEIATGLGLRKSQNKIVWSVLNGLKDDEDRHSRRYFVENRNLVWAARRELIKANN